MHEHHALTQHSQTLTVEVFITKHFDDMLTVSLVHPLKAEPAF